MDQSSNNVICAPDITELIKPPKRVKCPFKDCEILLYKPAVTKHLKSVHNFNPKKHQIHYFCPVEKCSRHQNRNLPFKSLSLLRQHFKSVHKDSHKEFTCKKCDKNFRSKHLLNVHMEDCGVKYSCSCKSTFPTFSSLKAHATANKHSINFAPRVYVVPNPKIETNNKKRRYQHILPKTEDKSKFTIVMEVESDHQPISIVQDPSKNFIVRCNTKPLHISNCSHQKNIHQLDFSTEKSQVNQNKSENCFYLQMEDGSLLPCSNLNNIDYNSEVCLSKDLSTQTNLSVDQISQLPQEISTQASFSVDQISQLPQKISTQASLSVDQVSELAQEISTQTEKIDSESFQQNWYSDKTSQNQPVLASNFSCQTQFSTGIDKVFTDQLTKNQLSSCTQTIETNYNTKNKNLNCSIKSFECQKDFSTQTLFEDLQTCPVDFASQYLNSKSKNVDQKEASNMTEEEFLNIYLPSPCHKTKLNDLLDSSGIQNEASSMNFSTSSQTELFNERAIKSCDDFLCNIETQTEIPQNDWQDNLTSSYTQTMFKQDMLSCETQTDLNIDEWFN